MPVHSVEMSYDRGGDVLYISLEYPRLSKTVYFADDDFETVNWERREESSSEFVGVLVWAYSTWDLTALQQLLESRLGALPQLPKKL